MPRDVGQRRRGGETLQKGMPAKARWLTYAVGVGVRMRRAGVPHVMTARKHTSVPRTPSPPRSEDAPPSESTSGRGWVAGSGGRHHDSGDAG